MLNGYTLSITTFKWLKHRLILKFIPNLHFVHPVVAIDRRRDMVIRTMYISVYITTSATVETSPQQPNAETDPATD